MTLFENVGLKKVTIKATLKVTVPANLEVEMPSNLAKASTESVDSESQSDFQSCQVAARIVRSSGAINQQMET